MDGNVAARLTISTSAMSLTSARSSVLDVLHRLATVLYIFQLPAMSGVLMNSKCKMQNANTTVIRRGYSRTHSLHCDHAPVCILNSAFAFTSPAAPRPRSTCPPRNSSDAPPPVEMCVMRFRPRRPLAIAAIESPPPTMVVPVHVGHGACHADGSLREGVDARRHPSVHSITTVFASVKRGCRPTR
jgi:hypothetical protein